MREIKFRVWKELHGVGDFQEGGFMFVPKDNFVYELNNTNIHWRVMQYTGLKDKNGVEIYEGDVLEYKNGNKTAVYWNPVDVSYVPLAAEDWRYKSEVIGNIYQNPELIK